jgi:alkylated DNA repair dioxygenase AlkB
MALLNWYQDGNHYIGYHSDDEKQLVKGPAGETLVFSISFGQKRDLTLRPKKGVEGVECKVAMENNSVVVMGGLCQQTHKHAVLKVAGQKGKAMGRRINLTFRMFRPSQ